MGTLESGFIPEAGSESGPELPKLSISNGAQRALEIGSIPWLQLGRTRAKLCSMSCHLSRALGLARDISNEGLEKGQAPGDPGL